MSNLGKAAQPRRFYHHVLNGGTLTPENVSLMVQTIEELEAENARNNASIDALKLGLNELAAIAKERADRIEELEAENARMVVEKNRAIAASIEEMEASIKWVDEVYPSRIEAGGAGIEITWAEFNAMQRALGVKVDARIGDQEGRAGHNHKLRVRAQAAESRAEAAEAKLAAARNDALEDAAKACDDEVDRVEDAIKWGGAKPYIKRCEAAAYAMRDRSAAIRAMKSTSQT